LIWRQIEGSVITRPRDATSTPRKSTAHAGPKRESAPSARADVGAVYYLTAVGEKLQMKSKATLDEHFVRILSVIEGDTHIDVIRGWLRHYSDAQLSDWLKKLEIAGALKLRPPDYVPAPSFPDAGRKGRDYEAALTDTDLLRIGAGTVLGEALLKANGAYVSEERLKNRAPLAKASSEISVLLVEDDPEQAELASRRLGLAGYQVRMADSQRGFLADLRDHGVPDAICLDVELPDGDGFELLGYIRSHPRLALVPVILLTAQSEPEQIRKGLVLGADGYVPKPYAKSVLTDTLQRLLKHS
jgi:CheY-like chemotaxis protein